MSKILAPQHKLQSWEWHHIQVLYNLYPVCMQLSSSTVLRAAVHDIRQECWRPPGDTTTVSWLAVLPASFAWSAAAPEPLHEQLWSCLLRLSTAEGTAGVCCRSQQSMEA